MKFRTIQEVQQFLYSFRSRWDEQTALSFKFERIQRFAEILDNPQNKVKVIHVAGTSGKGSTTSIISHLLSSHGMKTGLSISPHVYDFRERYQINNSLLQEEVFLKYFHKFLPSIVRMQNSEYGDVTFFEISIMLAYFIFFLEKVDYAVMETGAGGRHDATNVANDMKKIAVITKIGLDHTTMLGKTISAIAGQKADIIHENNISISAKQKPSAEKVIKDRARCMSAELSIISPKTNYKSVKDEGGNMTFDFSYKNLALRKLKLSLKGIFQVENSSVALAAFYEVAKRDGIDLNENTIRETLLRISNPGRFDEIEIDGKKIIIDGAHNPQKMSAFIKSLKKKYPGEVFDFLIAFKHGKDFSGMLKYIVPLASDITATEFILSEQAEIMNADKAEDIKSVLNTKFNFDRVETISDSTQAFDAARIKSNRTLVITGSLYLVGEVYRELRKRTQAVG